MQTQTWHCAQCTKTVEGFIGPIEVANPNRPTTLDPPGTGWFRFEGPSFGMGFLEKAVMVCSVECGVSRLRGEPPAVKEEIIINGWKKAPAVRPPHPRDSISRSAETNEVIAFIHEVGEPLPEQNPQELEPLPIPEPLEDLPEPIIEHYVEGDENE